MAWAILLWALVWPIGIHAGGGHPENSLFVYKLDGTNHCETAPPIELAAMSRQLAHAGIEVISMHKGFDGREGIAVCGAPTGQINIYEIPAPGLEAALKSGFTRLPDSLTNQ